MNVEELKKLTIEKLNKLDDIESIEQINNLLDFETDRQIYCLNSSQILRVQEAKVEFNKSSILSEEIANQQIEKWLNEK
jgi:hypothetical protein